MLGDTQALPISGATVCGLRLVVHPTGPTVNSGSVVKNLHDVRTSSAKPGGATVLIALLNNVRTCDVRYQEGACLYASGKGI